MPSFTRRMPTTQTKPAPPGTIPSLSACTPPLHLLPCGIPSLDDLLGGGLPLGSIYGILAPDHHTAWARLVERYWIAQGLVTGQRSAVVGEEGESRDVVGGCMWIDERATGDGSESEGEGMGDVGQGKGGMRIAWRYERMKKFQTTVNQLNLMTPIPVDLLQHLEQTSIQTYIPLHSDGDNGGSSSKSSLGWNILSNALRNIVELLAKHDDKSALRLTIHDLGSVDWGCPSASEMHRFLHALRGLVRSRAVGVLVTFPSDLCRTGPPGSTSAEDWSSRVGWLVDALIELRGFGDDPTLPPLFHPLHGLISLPVLPTTHHLLPPSFKHSSLLGLAGTAGSGGAGENNLGFRLKRKRFVVETVHLGIEGGTGERRTEPKPELGSLVGASSGSGPSEGVERVQVSQSADGGQAHEGEKEKEQDRGVTRPKGADGDKPKKPRARVRFGGEEEMTGPEVHVGTSGNGVHGGHDHDHHHEHGHTHGHGPVNGHGQSSMPARPVVRHDRPDLYEF